MKTISLVLGIFSIIFMFVALTPCLGALNWINIPFAFVGFIVSLISLLLSRPGEPKGNAIAGLAMCACAMLIGSIRLIIGLGVF